jgi:hypothetical protein
MFEKGKVNSSAGAFLAAVFIIMAVFIISVKPYIDSYKSVKKFCLESAEHIPKDATVVFYHEWNTEAVFFTGRDYERAWTSDEVFDFQNNKLKYEYIICPKGIYEVMEEPFKRRVEMLAETKDGHQYPKVFLRSKQLD